MAKKKQPWEILSAEQQKQAASKATAKVRKDAPGGDEVRKMLRIGEVEHLLAKTVATMQGETMQGYVERLIREDAQRNYPDMFKKIAG